MLEWASGWENAARVCETARGSCRERSAIVGGKSRARQVAASRDRSRRRVREGLHLASPLLLCQCHYIRRAGTKRTRDMAITSLASAIIVRPLRDLRAARAARRHAVRAMQGGGEARAPRAERALRVPAAPVGRHRFAGRRRTHSSAPAPRARRSRRVSRDPGGWGTYATLVAFGVAVCLTGYLALGELEDAANAPATIRWRCARRPRSAAQIAAAAAAIARGRRSVRAERVAREPRRRAMRNRASRGAGGPRTQRRAEAGARRSAVAGSTPAMRPPSRCRAPRCRRDGGAAGAADGAERAGARSPDRWQLLASALSRCERENAVVGLFCKERARLQYCDGQWGAAPQCPVGVASNNTR